MTSAPDHADDEMHELTQEADYLDQTVIVDHNGVNGGHKPTPSRGIGNDPDAQAQVIESLRTQVQDLFSQVSQLNNKLVRSYDRVSDLEDELHVTSANLRKSTLQVSQLELERTQHLSALSTGLLVEKSHVTTELTRLMEKATEEAARAGEAESARVAIEKDLDDLSANLFDQANTMVAEARLGRARSERKVEETEKALRGAEEIVGVLQAQMQALQAEKEQADKRVEEMSLSMGKGKWVERAHSGGLTTEVRLLRVHSPYMEYVQFVAHLRTIRPATPNPPAMSTLLPLPFLARLVAEDSDPTIRLDLAPSLNWLTRRSVLSAIHSGQLNVEPMSTHTLLEELISHSLPGMSQTTHVTCALCGTSILDSQAMTPRPPPHPSSPGSFGKAAWGSSFLKTSLVQTISATSFGSSTSRSASTLMPLEPPSQVYIFRLEATASSGLPVSLPLQSQQPGAPARTATVYPLCASRWCLYRLRTTCSLWAFIRTGVVEKIWEDDPFMPPSRTNSPRIGGTMDPPNMHFGDSKPPLTPKKSRIGIGALWGNVSRSLSNTGRPESESPQSREDPVKEPSKVPASPRRLPPPPPRHPPVAAPVAVHPATGPPPPLPRRNMQRNASPAPARPSPSENPESTSRSATPPHDGSESMPAMSPPEDTHEVFTTPVEEISPPSFHRPMSPSSVPLPPSAPGTPVPPAADVPHVFRTSTPPPPPPRRRDHTVNPATSASATIPPPLPRRAATRARPSSLNVVSVIHPPSDAVAPPEATGSSNTKEGGHDQLEPAHKEEVVSNAKVEPTGIPTEVNDTHESPSVAHEVSEREKEDSNASKSSASLTSPNLSSPEMPSPEEPRIDNTSDTRPLSEEPEPQDIAVSSQVAPDLDTTLYVGTATWEERTWRELVKLREEMLWARLGGIRVNVS